MILIHEIFLKRTSFCIHSFFSCTNSEMKEGEPMGEWEYLEKLLEESLELNGV